MLYREIIAVCSEIHTKHINTVSGQNVELVNVKVITGQQSVQFSSLLRQNIIKEYNLFIESCCTQHTAKSAMSFLPNFIQIGRKMSKIGQNFSPVIPASTTL
jgi:hypothetical protein